jgi:hypothetical protein
VGNFLRHQERAGALNFLFPPLPPCRGSHRQACNAPLATSSARLQFKYDDYRAAGPSLICLSGLGSGEPPNPEFLGGDK